MSTPAGPKLSPMTPTNLPEDLSIGSSSPSALSLLSKSPSSGVSLFTSSPSLSNNDGSMTEKLHELKLQADVVQKQAAAAATSLQDQ